MHYLPLPPPPILIVLTLAFCAVEVVASIALNRIVARVAGRAGELAEPVESYSVVCGEE